RTTINYNILLTDHESIGRPNPAIQARTSPQNPAQLTSPVLQLLPWQAAAWCRSTGTGRC
ncbi:MAG: hypothetical protein ACKO6H_00490, partial [Betaproteobacteria bacterium]